MDQSQNQVPTWQFWVAIAIAIAFVIGLALAWIYFTDGGRTPVPTETLEPTAPTVMTPTGAPPTRAGSVVIQAFSVDNERFLAGECANLTWQVENADTIRLERDGGLLIDLAPSNHTFRECLDQPGTFVYRLEVENDAGSATWMELQVIVEPQPQPTATPIPLPTALPEVLLPPASGPVTINSYTIELPRVRVGACSTISWEVFHADQIQLLRDGVIIVPSAQLKDSYEDCFDETGIYVYRLEARNSEGYFNLMELQVIVDP